MRYVWRMPQVGPVMWVIDASNPPSGHPCLSILCPPPITQVFTHVQGYSHIFLLCRPHSLSQLNSNESRAGIQRHLHAPRLNNLDQHPHQ